MINKIKLRDLKRTYITKKLDSDTVLKVLSGEHPSVLHRLYLVANEVKEEHYFMELDHEALQCSAKVKIKFGYSGDARLQADTISFMKDRLKQKPKYLILFRIYEKIGMKDIFTFRHETTNLDDLISVINKLETRTKEICQNRVNTY